MQPNVSDAPQFSNREDGSRQAPIRFTPEEIRVIKDCNRESFFKRCLPVGAILGLGAYYGVKTGYLKPSAKLGASPKVIIAVVLGYFIGKISYQSKCAERLMQLPNSPLGEILRQRRRGNKESLDSGFGTGISLAPFGNINPADTYTDVDSYRPASTYDLDSSRPQYDGLDEYSRPSLDNPIYEEEMPPVQKNVTTYDELRKQNREEFQQKRIGNYKEPSKTTQMYQQLPAPSLNSSTSSIGKNKYGDDME